MRDKKNKGIFYDCTIGAVHKSRERLKKYAVSLKDRKKV